jgi:hypothetical protein
MPSHHYRRHILQNYDNDNTTSIYLTSYTNIIIDQPIQQNNELIKFQKYIFDIIDTITTTLDIQAVTNKVNELLQIIKTREDMYKILDLIENNILSVITNIANSVDIGIIRCRFQYIRELISKIPHTADICHTYIHNEFYTLIFGFIESLTTSNDFSLVISEISAFKITLQDDIAFADNIDLIQDTILDIIKNIKNNVDIGIIRCRIQYLKELINRLNC